jgi:DNA-binding SARP family transcriptional activator
MPTCLYMLNQPHVQVESERIEITPSRPTALLMYLAYQGEWINRETLAELFWPEQPEDEARHNLRINLHRAKQLPWAIRLEVERSRLRFSIQTDVAHFREALGCADWQAAVQWHQRPLLDGFALHDLSAFEEWVNLERQGLQNAWSNAAQCHAEQLQQRGEHNEASVLLLELLRHDLLAEDVMQAYMRAAYLAGQRDAALRLFERFSTELERDLGLEPMQETQELVQRLRRSQPLQAPTQLTPSRIPLEVMRPPRLVGRTLERAQLNDATLALVSGEPGIGKTPLITETLPDARWLRCREGLDSVPYQPVIELLRSNLDTLPDLGPYREDLARLIPEIMPGGTIGPAEPQSAKVRLLEAFSRALEATDTPLVADDLQWADGSTLELLVFLVSRGKLRLVCAYRSTEITAGLHTILEGLRSHQAIELKLKPLTPDDIRALMGVLSGVPDGPELFSHWLSEKSGGNTFFALEVLRSLFETGVLEERDGLWHTAVDDITRDYTELEVPARVTQVVERRVQRLSEPARRVVQAASVVRQGFTPKLLADTVGLSEFAVLDAIEEIEGVGLITGTRFQHDLMRQSIYASLPDVRCKSLHLRVAETLGNHFEPAVLAEHWRAAEEFPKAVQCWLEVAHTYRTRAMLTEAISVLEKALQHTSDAFQRIEIMVLLGRAHREAGNYSAAHDQIDKVLGNQPPPRCRADALIERAWLLLGQGQPEEASRDIDEVARTAIAWESGPLNEESLELAVAKLRSNLAFRAGRFEESCTILEPMAVRLRQQAPSVTLAGVLVSLGAGYDNLGQETRAIPLLQEALRMAQTTNARYYQVDAANNLLTCLIRLGRTEEGLFEAESALALGRYEGTDHLCNTLAVAYLSLGRETDAIRLFEAVARDGSDAMLRVLAWARLTDLYHHGGREAETEPALDNALAVAFGMNPKAVPPRLALTLFQHGSDAQLARAETILAAVETESMPAHFREQLEQARAERAARSSPGH